jgi:hypothetical protein
MKVKKILIIIFLYLFLYPAFSQEWIKTSNGCSMWYPLENNVSVKSLKWSNQCSSRLFEGTGEAILVENNNIITKIKGTFKKGKLSGFYEMQDSLGNSLSGSSLDGEISGNIVFKSHDGSIYNGNFLNGKRNGLGELQYGNGIKYFGNFENGLQSGEGALTFTNGDKFFGNFLHGKRNGQGTYIWSNGNKYIGEWSDNKMNGKGSMIYSNGQTKTSEWKDGLITRDYEQEAKIEEQLKAIEATKRQIQIIQNQIDAMNDYERRMQLLNLSAKLLAPPQANAQQESPSESTRSGITHFLKRSWQNNTDTMCSYDDGSVDNIGVGICPLTKR